GCEERLGHRLRRRIRSGDDTLPGNVMTPVRSAGVKLPLDGWSFHAIDGSAQGRAEGDASEDADPATARAEDPAPAHDRGGHLPPAAGAGGRDRPGHR